MKLAIQPMIQPMDHNAALVGGTRLAGAALLPPAMALAVVWLGMLATAVDWTSPNVGTGIACTAAVSAVRVVTAKLSRPRALRFLAGPALALVVVVVLLGASVGSVVALAEHAQGSAPAAQVASAGSSLILGGAPGVVLGRMTLSPTGSVVSAAPTTARTDTYSGAGDTSSGRSERTRWRASHIPAADPTEHGGGVGVVAGLNRLPIRD